MTALGLASIASDDAELAPCVSTVSHSGQQKWVKRSENVRDRQNRQCLCCGRIERLYGRVRHYRDLEIHHVRWQQHGGTDAYRNLIGVCRACHKLMHNSGRAMPFAARVILALQVLRPESMLITRACRVLFRLFLKSAAATSFHPAAMRLRPWRTTDDGLRLVAREEVA
jgi:hypothetical protein